MEKRKSGKFSDAVPERYLDDYERALADPNLLSLRDEIALLDARIIELLKRVDSRTLLRIAEEDEDSAASLRSLVKTIELRLKCIRSERRNRSE